MPIEGPCVDRAVKAGLMGGLVGTFFGSCSNLWFPDPLPVPNSSKKFGATALSKTTETAARSALFYGLVRPAIWFGAVGASFAAAECVAESIRGKKDSVNAGFGGVVAGAVMGSIFRRADLMVSSAMGCGLLMFSFDFAISNTEADRPQVYRKMYDTLPEKHEESETLWALKEKYQKFKDN